MWRPGAKRGVGWEWRASLGRSEPLGGGTWQAQQALSETLAVYLSQKMSSPPLAALGSLLAPSGDRPCVGRDSTGASSRRSPALAPSAPPPSELRVSQALSPYLSPEPSSSGTGPGRPCGDRGGRQTQD